VIHAGGLARSFRTRRGTVEAVCGVDIHVAPGCDLLRDPVGVRRRIGYVGQAGGAGPDCPALDELVLQGRLYGMPAQRAYVRGRELLGQLELTGTPTSSNGPSRATPLNWAPTRRGTPRSSPGRRPAPPGWLYRAPPCGSVSGILLPMSLAPLWLYTVSRFNPSSMSWMRPKLRSWATSTAPPSCSESSPPWGSPSSR
jgi:hypothetical protein